MSALTKKIGTFGRVVRREGVTGVMTVLKQKTVPIFRPSLEYARIAPSAVSLLARHGRPDLLINAVGAGIGDDLLCTAVFHELRRRGTQKFWVTNKHPELYENNADVTVVAPPLSRYDIVLKQLGVKVLYPWYTSFHPAYDRDDPMPEQHLISVMCQRAGITGTIALRPYLSLTDAERAAGRIAPRQIAIQSSGLDAKHAMRNKNWSLDSYQQVVTALKSTYDFVQVGSRNDPLLDGAIDMRGKTTLRQSAAILAGSLAFVGQVGFLMHLARAVDCRSVVVYGGRETPAQSGYPCNENLYSPVSCSPCWFLNKCPYDRMCLQMVSPADVVEAIGRQVARQGEPLACDTDTITSEQAERYLVRYEEAVAAHQLAWAVLYPPTRPARARVRRAARAAQQTGPVPPVVRAIRADDDHFMDPTKPTAVLRVHDELDGQGDVYDGERLLARVDYSLKDVSEITYTPAIGDANAEAVFGERTIYGVLRSPKSPQLSDFVGARLALQLEGGRLLQFTVSKVMLVDTFLVQSLGDVRSGDVRSGAVAA